MNTYQFSVHVEYSGTINSFLIDWDGETVEHAILQLSNMLSSNSTSYVFVDRTKRIRVYPLHSINSIKITPLTEVD